MSTKPYFVATANSACDSAILLMILHKQIKPIKRSILILILLEMLRIRHQNFTIKLSTFQTPQRKIQVLPYLAQSNCLIYLQLYPEYYEVINEPIDIKTICTRVRVCNTLLNSHTLNFIER